MAHTKSAGSTALGRDSESKRLGVKIPGGKKAFAGQIIIRQRGTIFRPGTNVRRGSDDTLYASLNGVVSYKQRIIWSFNGKRKKVKFVSVGQ